MFEHFLKKLIEESEDTQFVWLAVKMDQSDGEAFCNLAHTFYLPLARVDGGNSLALENLITSLRRAGWVVPNLVNNMRNSKQIAEAANKMKTPIGKKQKGTPCTVTGFSPLLLTVDR